MMRCIAVALVGQLAATALAAFVPYYTDRDVMATASQFDGGIWSGSHAETGLDGAFDAYAHAALGDPPEMDMLYATQHSLIELGHISGVVQASATWEEVSSFWGHAISDLYVLFSVTDEPLVVRTFGTVQRTNDRNFSGAAVGILRDGENVLYVSAPVDGSVATFDEVLTLAPGDYDLSAFASALSWLGTGTCDATLSFDMTVIPEPSVAPALAACFVLLRPRRVASVIQTVR